MKIRVTQQDISKAKRLKKKRSYFACIHCPISQSLRRQTKKKIRTFKKICFIGEKDYIMDINGTDFIKNFDKNYKVRPTTIELTEI